MLRQRRRGKTAIAFLCLMVYCGWVHAAETEPGTSGPVLKYEVAEAQSEKLLYTMWEWNEEVTGAPPRIAALSKIAFPRGEVLHQREIYTRDNPPRCLAWERITKDRNGTVVASLQGSFVPEAFPFLATQSLPPNAYPPFVTLLHVLTHLGLGQQQRASFYYVLSTSSLQMDLRVEGRERIEVPAGAFDCHRVSIRANADSLFPRLPNFVRPFVSFFIPTHTVWLSVEEPQVVVKYMGLLGPPGSSEVVVQLVGESGKQTGVSRTPAAQ